MKGEDWIDKTANPSANLKEEESLQWTEAVDFAQGQYGIVCQLVGAN